MHPELYYSTEVVPAAECDVEPLDPAVVREAAARVYARPLGEATATPPAEPPSVGISYWTSIPNQSLNVYVDGVPFIERDRPVDGIPARPGEHLYPATVVDIIAAMSTLFACWNTGDPTRTFPLSTTHGIEASVEVARVLGAPPAEQSDFDDVSTLSRAIPDDERLLAPTVGDIRISRDGTAVIYGPLWITRRSVSLEPERQELFVVILKPVDGEWRIDERLPGRIGPVVIAPDTLRPTGTPVPLT